MKHLNTLFAVLACSLSSYTWAEQSCSNTILRTTPTNQFTDIGNEVTDKKTGLTWAKCFLGQSWDSENKTCTGRATIYTWKQAMETVASQVKSGALPAGSRLPNIKELTSLREASCTKPAMNLEVFSLPDERGNGGWIISSTPSKSYDTRSWAYISEFGITRPEERTGGFSVLPVRVSNK